MDHPGLLFGWRDPTLRNSYFSDSKEYTYEYCTCLVQRLLWIATSISDFRRLIYIQHLNSIKNGLNDLSTYIPQQEQALKKGVRDSLFRVTQSIPSLPTSIVNEQILLYGKTMFLHYTPLNVEPDEDISSTVLIKTQYGQDLLQIFRDTINAIKAVEEGKLDKKIKVKSVIEIQFLFFKRTGYIWNELRTLIR